MHISRRQSIVIAIGALVIFFGWGIWSIPRRPQATPHPPLVGATPSPALPATPAEPSTFSLRQFQRSEVKDGRTVWEIIGGEAQYFPEKNGVRIQDPKLTLYQRDGVVKMSAQAADLTIIGSELQLVDARGNVVVISSDSTRFETELVHYNHQKQLLHAPQRVKIAGSMVDIEGDSLDGDMKTEKFIVKGTVRSLIKPKEGM